MLKLLLLLMYTHMSCLCWCATGSSIASVVKGYTLDSSSSSSKSYQIAFAGYADSAAAQEALEGCVTEVLTR